MITKAQEAELKRYLKATPEASQCFMHTQGITKTVFYWFLPVVGWIEPREEFPWLILAGALLKIGDQAHAGSGSWHIPVSPHNGDKPLRLLSALGWDGRIWPEDQGWPSGHAEALGLQRVLGGIPILNTFAFPPDKTKGNSVIKVMAAKSGGVFALPPEVQGEDAPPSPELAATFDRLVKDPAIFMPSTWTPGKLRSLKGVNFDVNP